MAGITLRGSLDEGHDAVVDGTALGFVADLHRRFESRRRQILVDRAVRRRRWREGESMALLPETAAVRTGSWEVAPPRPDLLDRRVEITGPVDRKMIINALNSGARVFMADFEDATAPTWANVVGGQINLIDAVRGTISWAEGDRHYRLGPDPAVLTVRPRGWHLVERHLLVDDDPVSGSLFDAGLYLFHNAAELAARGTGPYLYLPKLESHLEARLWNDVFLHVQRALGLPTGTIRATVLVETLPAAFEMDEILYELREHSSGLNAGRWDYIFSVIRTLGRGAPPFPDRSQIVMTVPFMRAYTERLVATAHRRGAHAIGGMAAFVPNRRKPEVTERAVAAIRADKQREAGDGFDGTWVAHPDLVPVAREEFDAVLGSSPHQLHQHRGGPGPDVAGLLDVAVPGAVTEAGLRQNVSVGLRYLVSWLSGVGAAAIDDLMEDAATAEISRSQVWQWLQAGVTLDDGRPILPELVEAVISEEVAAIRVLLPDPGRLDVAVSLFCSLVLADEFVEFLTPLAYDHLDRGVTDG